MAHSACDPPCAVVIVLSPDAVEEGQPIMFVVNVAGGEQNVTLSYVWTVSSGVILEGQGTRTIKVETTGLAGLNVEAKVKVAGLPPECTNQTSSTTKVRKKT